ncbi:hypothetical protein MJL81_29680, partial [Salmonella enterica subsp. enterica serovar Anatum]|nr:hypothetical protein [Salmonella enterica subsp. enterica serovar Anatum]
RAKRYLAYFQAYTSTFAEVQVLRSMYQEAVSQASIVGLCVGTVPILSPSFPRRGAEISAEIPGTEAINPLRKAMLLLSGIIDLI